LLRLLEPRTVAKRDCLGRLPLHRACAGGATHDAVAMLLQKYPEAVRVPRINGRLPLHDACFYSFAQSVPTVNCLIRAYPEATLRPAFDGYLPLHDFCRANVFGHVAVMEKLMMYIPKTKAVLMIKTNDGSLPIHVASASSNSRKLVPKLIESCLESVFVRDGNNALPLHLVCRRRPNLELVEALLAIYPDGARAFDREGKLPIHHLCLSGSNDPKTAEALLKHHPEGAKEFDMLNKLPLHHLCSSDFPQAQIAQLLLEFHPGAARTKLTNSGQLPLHIICASVGAQRDVIETVLAANLGAIGALDGKWRDPLMIACENKFLCNEIRSLEVLMMLVRAKIAAEGSLVRCIKKGRNRNYQ